MRDTPIIFLSNQIFSGPGNVAQLSTSIGGVFTTQQNSFTTSNLTVNHGFIRLSNTLGDVNYLGQGAQLSNTGLLVNSDQFAALKVVNPTGTIAEATFDTTAAGGPLLAMGAGSASRGAYFFVGGDAININQSNQAVSIANGGTAQTAYKLFVNGNAGFTSSITLSNGDFSMSNTRTQKADLISTGLNIYSANFVLSNGAASGATANLSNTAFNIYNGNFLQSNTVVGTATFCNTNMTVNGALSTTGINYTGGALIGNSYGSISSLALGAVALAPPAVNAALDINGTMRSRVQRIQTNGSISSIGGNYIYFNIVAPITVNLPSVTSTLGGTLFYGHKDTGNTVTISSIAGELINGGTTSYVAASGDKIVSMMQLGTSWSVTSVA